MKLAICVTLTATNEAGTKKSATTVMAFMDWDSPTAFWDRPRRAPLPCMVATVIIFMNSVFRIAMTSRSFEVGEGVD